MLACLYLLDSDLATSSHRPSTLLCRTHVEHMRSQAFSESFSLSFPSNVGTVVHQVPDACLRLPTLASSLPPLPRRAACNRCSCVLLLLLGSTRTVLSVVMRNSISLPLPTWAQPPALTRLPIPRDLPLKQPEFVRVPSHHSSQVFHHLPL